MTRTTTIDVRTKWDKLVLELKNLRHDDIGALVPLCIGIQSVLSPTENYESCLRNLQFMGFELLKSCELKSALERWQRLREFLFNEKGFELSSVAAPQIGEEVLLMQPVLQKRAGHPLPLAFILLNLAGRLELPMALIQARHHFLLRWVRPGETVYLDLYNQARALSEAELIQVLNRSASNLEVWSSKQLMFQYLELLRGAFERARSLLQLHTVFNLLLQLDDANTAILGQRALLRQKLGLTREALTDLKRYFSFVEKAHAPFELRQCLQELEYSPTEACSRPTTEFLH